MQGLSLEETMVKTKRDGMIYMKTDTCFWPVMMLFGYRFVPNHLQLFFVQGVGFTSGIIKSTIESRKVVTVTPSLTKDM